MRITLIVQQTFDIKARTLLQAHRALRDGWHPESEILLAVNDERGHDITKRWHKVGAEMKD
jgi:hypothetical protein